MNKFNPDKEIKRLNEITKELSWRINLPVHARQGQLERMRNRLIKKFEENGCELEFSVDRA